ncbi:hypothetical protein CEXT_290091 [Caerostris extrusa]|uniref:Uncharacterized protein n=1 Tax=Caerostris extrusa TaxID=172846 RepID=A0AAV4Y5D6_CAEEX|nr:hypothetical protein CEXT_290091 [Caerostris extrusa]
METGKVVGTRPNYLSFFFLSSLFSLFLLRLDKELKRPLTAKQPLSPTCARYRYFSKKLPYFKKWLGYRNILITNECLISNNSTGLRTISSIFIEN